MRASPLSPPPRGVRKARLDNLTLVPGNLLPYKDQWQQVANRLPKDAILIVLPSDSRARNGLLLTVAEILAGRGHQVRVLSVDQVCR